jgi:beta-lactamase class A
LALRPYQPGETIDRAKWQEDKSHATGAAARRAFRYYLEHDHRDSATPAAMALFLQELYLGELLSPESTKYLIDIMAATKTGVHRLKEGVPANSVLAHKTGTGPDLDGINSATNDIGIAYVSVNSLPEKRKFAIAVFLSGSRLSEDERDAVIRDVCRCAVGQIVENSRK